jgi:asparagine synthase (glutamine-hydrolysing)
LLKKTPAIKPDDDLSATNEASWMEINLFMKNQLLRDADAMSMAHGLEIRLPFLDVELLRFAHSINSKEKFTGKYPKQLLIDCYRNEIPELVWKRPKMGFTFPFREWFSDARYAHQGGDPAASACHRRMQDGKIHWSQFYTRWLMKHYA